MLKETFTIGPFTIRPAGRMQVAGKTQQLFDIAYGPQPLRERVPVNPGTQKQVADQLDESISNITTELRAEHECSHRIDLVDGQGKRLASFKAESSVIGDMSAGLVDDRFHYWLRSANKLQSQPVTLDEYSRLRTQYERPARAWIADLFDDEVLTSNADDWRAPSAWELRHIVGVGSLTGISGAKAADLVGVNASSFRKYTAREEAKNRQAMSFAMWHLLLHRLEIQRMPEGWS